MNHYTVEWRKGAEGDLARIWIPAADKQAVNAASDAIDRLLAPAPKKSGTAVAEGLYRIAVPPLVAYFSIDDDARIVYVEAVKRIV